ncbi:MAG: sulfatase [Verrucomicrobiota bacterium]
MIRLLPLVALVLIPAGLVAQSRPNILMIAVDDLRPMLGCYGDERMHTPHIDRLAEEGMLFERAYCNYAKCGPSRLSLMTGLRPENIGIYDNNEKSVEAFREKRPDAVTLGEWFRTVGYETRSFGKIDHDGWQRMEDWSEPPSPGREREMWEVMPEDDPTGETIIAERTNCPVAQAPDVADEHLYAGRMAREVEEELATRDDERPFFYAVGFRRPHLPFIAPKRYFDLYEPDESWLTSNPEPPTGVPFFPWFNSDGYVGMAKRQGEPMPEKFSVADAIAFNGYEMRSYVGVPLRGELSTELQIDLIHAYAACVSYVDAQIGIILDRLEAEGLRENTIIALWSDHGWHLGEMSAWGKMTNYEISNRVPLLLSAPGYMPGSTDSLAELVDLYPTLCAIAGIDPPGHLEGDDLTPVLKDPDQSVKEVVRHEYMRFKGRFIGHALRDDRYRFVRWSNRGGETIAEELYDLSEDPLETKNVVEEKPEVAASMRDHVQP